MSFGIYREENCLLPCKKYGCDLNLHENDSICELNIRISVMSSSRKLT